MRKLKFSVLLAALVTVGVGKSYAHNIEVANADGVTIYYNFINNRTELAVTFQGSDYDSGAAYAGKVVIPESVTYEGTNYRVTSIGYSAFRKCRDMTEVTIPNSVTSIGDFAFYWCSVRELIIPNSVTSIGDYAFQNCNGLTELTIPGSVTSIGDYAFDMCYNLTELSIPSSVTSIGSNPFRACRGLAKITVESGNPNYDSREDCNAIIETNSNALITGCKNTIILNSVTTIGEHAFSGCWDLPELTIPNSVTSIGNGAFYQCFGLTKVTIPNSVTSIGNSAFWNCVELRRVTIGNSVTSIGNEAFQACYVGTIYSLNTTPPSVANTNAFDGRLYGIADLLVPEEALEAYQNAEVWKNFQKLQAIEAEKCATPTIHYANNKLTFKCETEGVAYESTITDTDIASYSNDEIDLSVTYTVTVYATKAGYANSDVATATLCWIDVEPKTEGLTDDNTAVQQISATPVLIQSVNGQITVTGLTDGTTVAVYTLSGQQVGTATSMGGQATVSTTLTTGTTAIVKMGDNKSVKIAVK